MSVSPTSGVRPDRPRLDLDRQRQADGSPKAETRADPTTKPAQTEATSQAEAAPRPTAEQVRDRVEDRQARARADSQLAQFRAELDRGVDASAPTSLLTERVGDGEHNCLEDAATFARPGRDEVVFMDDTRGAEAGNTNAAGHTLIRDRASGRVWDPNDGAPPTNPQAWTYRDADAWVAANGGAPGGRPAYEEAGAVPAEQVQDVLSVPPEQRADRIAEIDNPTLTRVADRMYADGEPPTPASTDPGIPAARRAQIEAFAADNADHRFPGQPTLDAIRGESDLGELDEAEQRYLLDRTVQEWRDMEGGLYLGYGTGRLMAESRDDPALGRMVSDVFSSHAVDAAATAAGAEPDSVTAIDARHDAATLATRAVSAAGSPEARRQMLDRLGPEGANRLVGALQLGDEDFFGVHTPGASERYEAATGLLEATNGGPISDTSRAVTERAFAELPPAAYEGRAGAHTRQQMATALSNHWHPDDATARAADAARFEGILGTSQGRDLLANTQVPPQARADAINLLRTHPEMDAAYLSSHDGNGWTHPGLMREMARPRARDFMALRGDDPRTLSGTDLENTVGFAMGFSPSVPEGETDAARDAREAAVAAGEHDYYADGLAGDAVRPVAAAIRELGGDDPQVTVLPIQYSSPETGPVELPLFRVQDRETGEDRFVDNTGRTYRSFDDWRSNNQLPPGNMVYPTHGHLRPTAEGEPALGTRNTPETVDTVGEHLTNVLDGAALVGGVVAGGFIIAGSGGTAAPIVLGGASLWGAARSGERLHDRATHGQSINPFTDAGARAEWLNFGANSLGVFGLGATGVASRLASRGSALTPLAASAAGALNVAAAGADALAVGDAGYTLATRWDELSGGERAQLGLSMAFWGVSAAARPRLAGAQPVDAFDANAMRRALVQQETDFQLGRAGAYVDTTLPPGARPDAHELLTGVANNDRITGFRDWVEFSTQHPGVDPAMQARNLADDLGELAVAQGLPLRPGERVHVGGDAHAPMRPGTNDPLTSFDLRITGPNGVRNIEVYSPQGNPPRHSDFTTAINHARDKIIRDASLPPGLHTTGAIEGAVRIGWPPSARNVGGGRIVTGPNGDVVLHQGNGETRSMGNFFQQYTDMLNGPRAPSGAADVNALTVFDRSGTPLYRYTRDPATGTWSGAPQ